jgi:hypothetical protein
MLKDAGCYMRSLSPSNREHVAMTPMKVRKQRTERQHHLEKLSRECWRPIEM